VDRAGLTGRNTRGGGARRAAGRSVLVTVVERMPRSDDGSAATGGA